MALQMKMDNVRKIIWIVFILTSVLTWLVYSELWMVSLYYFVLSLLGIFCFCLGLCLVVSSHFSWHSILLVVIGLVIGQWWLLEQIVMQIIWKLKGMAP